MTSSTVVTLTASYSGVDATFGVTINPPPPTLSSISVSPSAITSGQSGTGTVTLTSAAGTGGVVVSLSSSNSTAATVPSSFTVPAGSTSATSHGHYRHREFFDASYIDRNLFRSDEDLRCHHQSGSGRSEQHLGQPQRNHQRPIRDAELSRSLQLLERAVSAISLSSSNTTAASVPSRVTVPAGSTSATFTVTAGTVSSSTPATLTASYTAQLDVRSND